MQKPFGFRIRQGKAQDQPTAWERFHKFAAITAPGLGGVVSWHLV
jgi:hypothetical protein